ncbi:hypothetical protein VZQ01_30170 [Myxococcus faecalis]|uniref:hypothetical protein n=1 Tax=Myxococcus faecalis TaxID=3115646 RepID=UPI0038D08F39
MPFATVVAEVEPVEGEATSAFVPVAAVAEGEPVEGETPSAFVPVAAVAEDEPVEGEILSTFVPFATVVAEGEPLDGDAPSTFAPFAESAVPARDGSVASPVGRVAAPLSGMLVCVAVSVAGAGFGSAAAGAGVSLAASTRMPAGGGGMGGGTPCEAGSEARFSTRRQKGSMRSQEECAQKQAKPQVFALFLDSQTTSRPVWPNEAPTVGAACQANAAGLRLRGFPLVRRLVG